MKRIKINHFQKLFASTMMLNDVTQVSTALGKQTEVNSRTQIIVYTMKTGDGYMSRIISSFIIHCMQGGINLKIIITKKWKLYI